MKISKPYLLFLGDAADQLAAKTAQGIKDWREGDCVGQLRMDGCKADTGLKDMTIEEARAAGAQTMVAGVANRGGIVSEAWTKVLLEALEARLDLAAGLHNRLSDIPELSQVADRLGRSIFDVRHPSGTYPVASGVKRTGKRLLPVGTDCSCGKMYTALAVEREMQKSGIKATFRATGQTGILIAGEGVSIDAVVADFISGTVETIARPTILTIGISLKGRGLCTMRPMRAFPRGFCTARSRTCLFCVTSQRAPICAGCHISRCPNLKSAWRPT